MSWHLFAVFFASTFFISATPGPNMLLAFQYGLNYGVKRTLWTLAGLSLGLFILLLSTLLGLDVISRQSPWLLTVIRPLVRFTLFIWVLHRGGIVAVAA